MIILLTAQQHRNLPWWVLQVVMDKRVIGGVAVRVGDEVIDGTVANRLAQVKRQLAG